MKVIILAGGQGTRMREETEFRPKPLVEIGGRPILWHIMKLYAHHGVRDFIVCLGYRGRMVKEYFLHYEAMNNDFTICLGEKHDLAFHGAHEEQDFRVTLVDTGLDAMTGSRVKQVQRFTGGGPVLVTYGDGVSDVDISALVRFHKSHGKLATVTTVRPISRFGIMELSDDDRVVNFAEKPRIDGWMSAGFFVFDEGVFDYLDADPECVMEREPLERLAAARELVAYRHEGFFYAMDTYREYQYLNELWNRHEAPWAVWRRGAGAR